MKKLLDNINVDVREMPIDEAKNLVLRLYSGKNTEISLELLK